MAEKVKVTAIVLAAGRGQRMNSRVPKQFMDLCGREIICYALEAFEHFDPVDQVILVTGADNVDYCREQIMEKYGYHKVSAVIAGGKERSDSVYNGLKAAQGTDYVMIHDGARPLLDQAVLQRCLRSVMTYDACIAAVKVKDTIKTASPEGVVTSTPDRSLVWQIQTPQCFRYTLIREAFEQARCKGLCGITDDAMVLEQTTGHPVHVVEGSYRNIKVTTPEDLILAQALLNAGEGDGHADPGRDTAAGAQLF